MMKETLSNPFFTQKILTYEQREVFYRHHMLINFDTSKKFWLRADSGHRSPTFGSYEEAIEWLVTLRMMKSS